MQRLRGILFSVFFLLAVGALLDTSVQSAFAQTLNGPDYFTVEAGSRSPGASQRLECPPGSLLSGVEVRTGEWFAHIAPSCVAVDSDGNWAGEIFAGPDLGGTGGSRRYNPSCRQNAYIASYSALRTHPSGGDEYVGLVQGECVNLRSGHLGGWGGGGTPYTVESEQVGDAQIGGPYGCPTGWVANGIVARTGDDDDIDRFGLICVDGSAYLSAPSRRPIAQYQPRPLPPSPGNSNLPEITQTPVMSAPSSPPPTAPGVMVFSDRAEFMRHVRNTTIVDFNSSPVGFNIQSRSFPGVTIRGHPDYPKCVAFTGGLTDWDLVAADFVPVFNFGNGNMIHVSVCQDMLFELAVPTTAVGFDFGGISPAPFRLEFASPETGIWQTVEAQSHPELRFFGIISPTPFRVFRIGAYRPGPAGAHILDNLTFCLNADCVRDHVPVGAVTERPTNDDSFCSRNPAACAARPCRIEVTPGLGKVPDGIIDRNGNCVPSEDVQPAASEAPQDYPPDAAERPTGFCERNPTACNARRCYIQVTPGLGRVPDGSIDRSGNCVPDADSPASANEQPAIDGTRYGPGSRCHRSWGDGVRDREGFCVRPSGRPGVTERPVGFCTQNPAACSGRPCTVQVSPGFGRIPEGTIDRYGNCVPTDQAPQPMPEETRPPAAVETPSPPPSETTTPPPPTAPQRPGFCTRNPAACRTTPGTTITAPPPTPANPVPY